MKELVKAAKSMMVSVEAYNESERSALKDLSNRQIQGFMPVAFSQLNYPTHVLAEEELIRYVDVMQEFRASLYYGQDFTYSKDEASLIKDICIKVGEVTQKAFGRKVLPWIGPLAAIPMFRVVTAIAGHFNKADLSLFEIGPGSGYLGALLMQKGYRYASTDNTQAFYLWQNRLYNHLASYDLGEVVHIPWWEYCTLYKSDRIKADVVICDHALGEMDKFGLKYVIRHSRQMMDGSQTPIFLFSEVGKQHVSTPDEIHAEFLSAGFVLINYHGGFFAYTPKDSPLKDYGIDLKTSSRAPFFLRAMRRSCRVFGRKRIFYNDVKDRLPFFNPGNSPERYRAREFMDISHTNAPLDYDFIQYLGYHIP